MKAKDFFLYLHCLLHNLLKGKLLGNDIEEHLPIVLSETKSTRPKIIVELGVRKGKSTKCLAQAAAAFNADLYGIDIKNCSKATDYQKYHFIKEDSIKAAKKFKQKKINALLIDTNHEFEHTKKEIAAWFPLLSNNSVVFFHDTNRKKIYQRKDKTIGVGCSKRTVIKAIEEHYLQKFTETEDFEIQIGTDNIKHYESSNGLMVIKRIK